MSSLIHAARTWCTQRRVVLSEEVPTKYGRVVGRKILPEVDAFQGIPFAKPPLGDLRFKKPQTPESWEGVLRTTKFAPRAIQFDIFFTDTLLYGPCSEDCLYLNVFTPTVTEKSKLEKRAVMVFIHGGGYCADSAVKYGDVGISEALVKAHGVVVVTIQYRLGLLGFFSTGDGGDACDDNCGLWDMTLALQWVQENIAQFGGDPSRVTIFGQSAGGASVDFLSLSPHSRDLFRNVIPMAGCASSDWAIDDNVVDKCRAFANRMGILSLDSHEVIGKLRTLPAKKLAMGLDIDGEWTGDKVRTGIGPRIDGIFFPKPLAQLRAEAPHKPRLVGVYNYTKNRSVSRIERVIAVNIPESTHNFLELRKEALQKYVAESEFGQEAAATRGLCKIFSDMFLSNSIQKNVNEQLEAGNSKVYLYCFEYFNPKSLGPFSCRFPFKAATHCTELAYLFKRSILAPYKFNADDYRMLEIMTSLFANFAKNSVPTGIANGKPIDWMPTTSSSPSRYLAINLTPLMREDFQENRPAFWLHAGWRESP